VGGSLSAAPLSKKKLKAAFPQSRLPQKKTATFLS
jgi:hypothetical protein